MSLPPTLARLLHRRPQTSVDTERQQAADLARLVLTKKKLGIALTPSQSLLLSREYLGLLQERASLR